VLDRVGVCAVVSASVGEGGKMLDGLLLFPSPCAVASGASRRPIPQLEHDVQQEQLDNFQQPPHHRVPRRRVSLRARRLRCLHARLESLASSSHFPSRISRSICHRYARRSSPRHTISSSQTHRLIVAYMLILSVEVVCSFIEYSVQCGAVQFLRLSCKLAQQRNQRGLALVLLHHGLDERLPLVGLALRIVRPLDHFQPIGGKGIVS
jgi:hypothetical protein